MKEIIIYLIAAIAGLTLFGYSIHMFVGGLVNSETETTIITVGCAIAATFMAAMAWDVIKGRRSTDKN